MNIRFVTSGLNECSLGHGSVVDCIVNKISTDNLQCTSDIKDCPNELFLIKKVKIACLNVLY